jgi:MFS family permease
MAVGWMQLLRGGSAARSAVIGGSMVLHALNTFIVATILPSVVREIGGLRYFSWSTVLYVVASLLGGATAARLLQRLGARPTYRCALGGFAAGSITCALAPLMPVLLAGRFVQGLGAGTLSALCFMMVRTLFPPPLWPPALVVVSVVWGGATLLGPAVGGVFAQYASWRAAFWAMAAVAPLLLLLVERALPRDLARAAPPAGALPVLNLFLLAGSVLAVSTGSMTGAVGWNALGLAIAVAALVAFARREAARSGVLPTGATRPATPLASVYAAMLLMIGATTPEIFVPYFLQTLHGLMPLHAGYLSALMSAGWTLGSLSSSGAGGARARAAIAAGPVVLASGLGGLAVLMPRASAPLAALGGIGVALLALGYGIGLAWPHLAARVFGFGAERERELAGASITLVVMVGSAFGAAFGGMVTNLAGLTRPGGIAGAASAAAWLFSVFIAAPTLAALAIRRLPAVVRPATAP